MTDWEKREYFERVALQTNMEIEEEAHAYLLLYCQNVFSDDFCLLLQWNHSVVEWKRNTLASIENETFFEDFSEKEQVLTFKLRQEKGFFERKNIPKLWEMLENLKVQAVPKRKSGEGRDGEIMELTLGTHKTRSTFYWHNCQTEPDWKPLDEIGDFLWELNKTLREDEKHFLRFSILTEVGK
jgi:hypothetical protein